MTFIKILKSEGIKTKMLTLFYLDVDVSIFIFRSKILTRFVLIAEEYQNY